MVAAGSTLVLVRWQLRNGQAAELSAPKDQGAVEKAALLQVPQQGGDGLVRAAASGPQVRRKRCVVVPDLAVDVELDEADSALDKPPGDQASPAVRIGRLLANSVHLLSCQGLLRKVHGIACRQLHARRQLVAGNSRVEVGLAGPLELVDPVQPSQEVPLELGDLRRPLRLGLQVEKRRAGGAKSCSLKHRG